MIGGGTGGGTGGAEGWRRSAEPGEREGGLAEAAAVLGAEELGKAEGQAEGDGAEVSGGADAEAQAHLVGEGLDVAVEAGLEPDPDGRQVDAGPDGNEDAVLVAVAALGEGDGELGLSDEPGLAPAAAQAGADAHDGLGGVGADEVGAEAGQERDAGRPGQGEASIEVAAGV